MRDHRIRASILPCVSRLVPHFHVGQVRVDALGIDVQRGHGLSGPQLLLTPVVYFGQAMSESLEARVAVNSDNIEDLQREVERARGRIHHLESTVHSVRMLTKAVDELQESMPTLARRAAQEAVAEDRRVRSRDWYSHVRAYAAVLTAGIALGALIVGLVLR